MSMTKSPQPRHVLDNRSNQLNPQHPEFYRSRGIDPPLAECLAVPKGPQKHTLTNFIAIPRKTRNPNK